jgi:hypothetical protein
LQGDADRVLVRLLLNFLKNTRVFSLLCLVNLFSSVAFGDWYSGNGAVALTNEQTLAQCKAAALQVAKTNIFSKAGLEKFSSHQMEICSETAEVVNCELHQQTLNYYEGAYITETRNLQVGNSASECTASLEADVRTYKSQHDPNFGLQATINGSNLKRNGEAVEVVGQVNNEAHLSLYVWSPSYSGDQYQLIFPNQFDQKHLLDGKFKIPSSDKSKPYHLYAEFPENQKGSAINEWLFLLATKSKFKTLDVESSENFYRRLDELGRENWRIELMGYTILPQ